MEMRNEILQIDVNLIVPNIYQPRKYFNEEALKELSESIKHNGILQPLSVRVMGERYELVAGERRWRAAKSIGLSKVPCTLLNITDKQAAELALLENLQREDLNFIEEAEAYFNLINEHGFTQEQLATRMGKKQSTIANKLRLLKLGNKVMDILLENKLTERHARSLLVLPDEDCQLRVLKKVVKQNLNVKATEELVNKELLKLKGEELSSGGKKKIKGVFSAKIYINSIKQVFDKFKIPAEYKSKDCGDYVQIVVNIPKNN
ncbi:chromosome partitioning protein, ParB family [Clostridium amylolyticum]|uniref:Chromosome partitioning protein, ParB family n=2 Tax=Clostridium amylolyticum TaxID=1121298 RepID=A0A1M6FUP6_9CLOT|nr:chromosome partitioning protein, ParB family [Clostridium amylolyticum]